jgi:hypothetical protein
MITPKSMQLVQCIQGEKRLRWWWNCGGKDNNGRLELVMDEVAAADEGSSDNGRDSRICGGGQ